MSGTIKLLWPDIQSCEIHAAINLAFDLIRQARPHLGDKSTARVDI